MSYALRTDIDDQVQEWKDLLMILKRGFLTSIYTNPTGLADKMNLNKCKIILLRYLIQIYNNPSVYNVHFVNLFYSNKG